MKILIVSVLLLSTLYLVNGQIDLPDMTKEEKMCVTPKAQVCVKKCPTQQEVDEATKTQKLPHCCVISQCINCVMDSVQGKCGRHVDEVLIRSKAGLEFAMNFQGCTNRDGSLACTYYFNQYIFIGVGSLVGVVLVGTVFFMLMRRRRNRFV